MTESAGAVAGFIEAAVRVATPLALAALGETLAERGGIINLGIEGSMLAGALAAAIASGAAGPGAGLLAGAAAGLALAAVFAGTAIGARANQIIAGTAVTLLATGLTGAIYRRVYGNAGAALTIPTLPALPIPGLSRLPLIGPAFFAQAVPTYLCYLSIPLLWWVLERTRWGLALSAAGEAPAAAAAHGVAVRRVRFSAVVAGGAMAGVGGASLVLAQVGTFAEQMTAGRGFIAIAIVVLGAWQPLRVAAAALLFGAAAALQFLFQALGTPVPYQFFLMLPYLLALAALAGRIGRVRAPAALGQDL
ncbi:MAG TPA: ABC transporter permease [Gemmatimonadales bacterium]|nr:ABC transporter permease [Gemmatimonadales bacterium]